MARAFYGSKISENRTKTPEGYLICHNVPIARSGWQDYTGREIGLEDDNIVQVWRDPDEVFNPAAIASFEGKTVTELHPGTASGFLSPESESAYNRGHAQNVRRGTGDEADLMLADLIIKDAGLISKVENDVLKEVSSGYAIDYVPFEDDPNKYRQVNIRGNHIAIVPNGRAGERVAIKDAAPQKKGEKKKMSIWKEMFGSWLKSKGADAEPEEVLKAAEAAKNAEAGKAKDADEGGGGGASLADVRAELESLKAEIAALVKSDQQVHEETGVDALEDLEKEVTKPVENAEDVEGYMAGGAFHPIRKSEGYSETAAGDPGSKHKSWKNAGHDDESELMSVVPSDTVSSGDLPDNPIPGADSKAVILAAIRTMKPIIAAIPDAGTRKKASDALANELKKIMPAKDAQPGNYAAVLAASRKNANDEKTTTDPAEEGRKIKEKYHRKPVAR